MQNSDDLHHTGFKTIEDDVRSDGSLAKGVVRRLKHGSDARALGDQADGGAQVMKVACGPPRTPMVA